MISKNQKAYQKDNANIHQTLTNRQKEKALIYLRVSTTAQKDERFSIAYQEESCKLLAKRNDLQVIKVFIDDYSGFTFERPAFKKLQEKISKEPIGSLIIFDMSRLARDAVGLVSFLISIYQELKINIYSVNQQGFQTIDKKPSSLDRYDINDLVKMMIYGLQVEYSAKMFLKRMYLGRRQALLNGCIANPTYGYENYELKDGSHRTVIKQSESKVVVLCVSYYLDGMRFAEIAKSLTEAGIDSGRFKCWSGKIVRRLILNKSYTGKFKFGDIYKELPHLTIIPRKKYLEVLERYKLESGRDKVVM